MKVTITVELDFTSFSDDPGLAILDISPRWTEVGGSIVDMIYPTGEGPTALRVLAIRTEPSSET